MSDKTPGKMKASRRLSRDLIETLKSDRVEKRSLVESQVTSLFTSIGHVSLCEVTDSGFSLRTPHQHKAERVLELFYEMKPTFPRLKDIELVEVSPYLLKVSTK